MHSFKIRFRLYDLLFYLLLVFSFYYTRNMMCRLMMVVFFCYTILQQIVRKSKTRISFFYVGFLIFILYGATNIVLDNVINVSVARTMVVSLFLNFLMIYAIVQYVYITNDIRRVIRITEFGIFTTAFVVMLLSWKTITQGRLGGGTEINANFLSLLCVYGFALCMYLHKIGKFTKFAYWFRIFFYTLAVLLTGSRKGVIMIAVVIVIVQVVSEKKSFTRIIRKVLLSFCVIAVGYILVMNVDMFYNIMGVRIENLFKLLTEGSTEEGSLKTRKMLVEIGMKYIREKPWTGYGYDCFKMISGMNGDGLVAAGEVGFYAHNNYIELLFGGGIIGFVLYYIPIVYLLKNLIKGISIDLCMPYLLAIFLAKLTVEYAHVAYYSRVDAYIIAVMLGCMLLSYKMQDRIK